MVFNARRRFPGASLSLCIVSYIAQVIYLVKGMIIDQNFTKWNQ